MADIRCPNCGMDNPDFLDDCQFCQAPLRPDPDPKIQTGDSPTKKNTGELEAVLPAWLQDVRQQSRDSAAEDAIEAATSPLIEKEAAPDLLAGLANQSASEDDEVPDWLADLNPVEEKESSKPSSSENTSPSDFFSQFEQDESAQPAVSADESAPEEMHAWINDEAQTPEQKDELSDWLSRTSNQSSDSLGFGLEALQTDEGKAPEEEPEETKEPEDLSWLHNLEASSKQTDDSSAPQADMGWTSNFDLPASGQSAESQADLGWLNELGGIPSTDSAESAFSQPASSGDDLGWLNNLGGDSASISDESPSPQPVSSEGDLDWLRNLGGEKPPAFDESMAAQPESPQGDLNWLNNLSDTTAPAFDEQVPVPPASPQDDVDWLKNLGNKSTLVFDESASNEAPTLHPSSPVHESGDIVEFG